MSHIAPAGEHGFRPHARQRPATLLVIGGSGFVGSAILRAAGMRPQLQAISCGRRQSHTLDALGVESRLCDAGDLDALIRALGDVTYVVNCVRGDARTMIAATQNICDAARHTGVRRLLHISSMAVYGDAEGVVSETAAPQPTSSYGRAKLQCETIVAEFAASGGDAVVLRPGCVYGPAGQQWVGRIVRWVRAGRLGELGALGTGYCNLTFNDDLASATLAALAADALPTRTFNVASPEPWRWNDYFRHVAKEIGVSVRACSRLRMQLEANVLAYPLQGMKLLSQSCGGAPDRFPEPITPSLLHLWRQRMRLDVAKARAMLDFDETPNATGLTLAVRSFRDAKPA